MKGQRVRYIDITPGDDWLEDLGPIPSCETIVLWERKMEFATYRIHNNLKKKFKDN